MRNEVKPQEKEAPSLPRDSESRAPRRWYKKKSYVAAGIIGLLIAAGLAGKDSATKQATNSSDSSSQPAAQAPAEPATTEQEPAAQHEPAPPPAPKSKFTEFEDGQYAVGTDIRPGTYRTRVGSDGCYWARLKDFDGGLDSILANENTAYPTVVTILSTDKGFEATNCGTWTTDLSALTPSMTSFEDGTQIVGADISPGTYRSGGGESCYWARLKDFTGTLNSVIANDNVEGSAIVTIRAGDKGFESTGCGTWTRR